MPKGGEFVKSRFLEQAALKIKVFAASTPANPRRNLKATVLDSGGFAAPQNKAACKGTNFERTCALAVFPPKSKRRNLERARRFLAGGALGALPRKVGGKTLTVDRVPGQSARKVSWLSTGLVDIKEGALAALPMMTSVNANTQWVSFKRAACAQRTRPERLRRGAAFCGSSCLALQCRRVSSV